MKNKGFTIIEVVMVLVVVAILSVITMLTISSAIRQIQIGSATDKMTSDLRYAQSMAAGTGKWFGVSFEVNPANRYTIYTTNGSVDTTVDNPAKLGSNFIVNVKTDYGTTISSVNIAGGGKVEFSPLGTPWNDKTPPGSAISAEGVVTLTNGSLTKTVHIWQNTGRVFIQ